MVMQQGGLQLWSLSVGFSIFKFQCSCFIVFLEYRELYVVFGFLVVG